MPKKKVLDPELRMRFVDLVEAGKVNELDERTTPLIRACKMLWEDLSVEEVDLIADTIIYLLENGADAKCFEERGTADSPDQYGPLQLASNGRHRTIELLKMLLDHGAQVDGPDGALETPLILVAKSRKLPAVQFFVENGASIDKPSKLNWARGATTAEDTLDLFWGQRRDKDAKAVMEYLKEVRARR